MTGQAVASSASNDSPSARSVPWETCQRIIYSACANLIILKGIVFRCFRGWNNEAAQKEGQKNPPSIGMPCAVAYTAALRKRVHIFNNQLKAYEHSLVIVQYRVDGDTKRFFIIGRSVDGDKGEFV